MLISNLPSRIGQALALHGGWGIFALSFLDSSLLSFPLVNDLLLIHLSIQFPLRMPVFVLASIAGSVAGAFVIYAIGYGGRKLASRRWPEEKRGDAERWIGRNAFVSILVVSLLPPPLPFKIFVATAGALRVNRLKFGAALLVGRGLRFAAEGWMAVHYGARAEAYLKGNAVWVSVTAAVLVAVTALVFRQMRKKP